MRGIAAIHTSMTMIQLNVGNSIWKPLERNASGTGQIEWFTYVEVVAASPDEIFRTAAAARSPFS